MNKKQLLISSLLLPISSLQAAPSIDAKNKVDECAKPNFIVIMCDDLGYENVSFNLYERSADQVSTPNIDRIANEGARCTAGYATYSVSGPSRAGFMTGRYGQRFGFERNPAYNPDELSIGIPLDQTTIAESLGQVGYTSGAIGKWHIGAHIKNHPCNRGFTEFFGHLGGGHQYYVKNFSIESSYTPPVKWSNYNDYGTYILRNHEPVHPDDMSSDYLTYAFTDEALSFVARHKDEPFFLYLAYNAPHGPLQAPDGTTANNSDSAEVRAEVYQKMVAAVDEGVGELLDLLEELGLDENTLIFFCSDNGGPEHVGANNGILRDQKSSIYEGGFRVPYAMRWPGKIEPQVYDKPVSLLDFFATASAITSSTSNYPLDGVNLIPYFAGECNDDPHEAIYLRKYDQGRYAIRSGDYKYIKMPQAGDENFSTLYNIVENISENDLNNPEHNNQTKIDELESKLEAWCEELIEPQFGKPQK